MYDRVRWVNANVIQKFAPMFDTLEFYSGLTTRFGCRYGDQRPFGGDYTNGWHIRGHEYLDSIIAKDEGGTADSLATQSSYMYWNTKLNRYDAVGPRIADQHGTYIDVGFFHPVDTTKSIADTAYADTTREYLFVVNRRVETGGDRNITCVFSRTKRPQWRQYAGVRITDMVTNESEVRLWNNDTTWYTSHYDRAQGKLLKIEPTNATFWAEGNATTWNNGRRMDYNGYYQMAFRRGNHVIYAIAGPQSTADPLSTSSTEWQVDTVLASGVTLDSAKNPCIRTDTGAAMIAFEGYKDSMCYIIQALNIGFFGPSIWGRNVVDSFRIDTSCGVCEATPVTCPFWKNFSFGGGSATAWGAIVAWSQGTNGIKLRPLSSKNLAQQV